VRSGKRQRFHNPDTDSPFIPPIFPLVGRPLLRASHTPYHSLHQQTGAPVVRQRGFTLIELMVVVVIVAILAAVAIPNYSQYVIRGKLVEAPSTLANLRVRMEQYFQDNRTYPTACVTGTPGATEIQMPTLAYFSYACPAASLTGTTYTITATSKTGQGLGAAGDYTYTLNQSNSQATTKFAGATCTATSWVLKKGGGC
jgi:type IV pilus assembly protein PilE